MDRYQPHIKKSAQTIKKQLDSFNPKTSAKKAIEILQQAKVANYALIGGIALWVHLDDEGNHRYTKDIDFAVPLDAISQIEQYIRQAQLNYKQLQIGGIGIRDEGISLDFIDRRLEFRALFEEALQKVQETVEIDENLAIPVVSKEYLIAMKLVSGEPKDDQDVKMLLKHASVDYETTRAIVTSHLGPAVKNRLDAFARELGILPPRDEYL